MEIGGEIDKNDWTRMDESVVGTEIDDVGDFGERHEA